MRPWNSLGTLVVCAVKGDYRRRRDVTTDPAICLKHTAPDLMPLWTILDSTPEGRGGNGYPKLAYPA
ncbi:MAG: hypothetical protein ABI846_00755 [Rudaea sp.]